MPCSQIWAKGCMAIEDSYQLALELETAWEQSIKSGSPIDVDSP